MKKFEFGKIYEEVEIAGTVYQIDCSSDEKVLQYQESFNKLHLEAKEIEAKANEGSPDKELLEKQLKLFKGIVEEILGVDTFEDLYEKAGKSLINFVPVITFLSEVVGGKLEGLREANKRNYINR